jgi:hypothetical protein
VITAEPEQIDPVNPKRQLAPKQNLATGFFAEQKCKAALLAVKALSVILTEFVTVDTFLNSINNMA